MLDVTQLPAESQIADTISDNWSDLSMGLMRPKGARILYTVAALIVMAIALGGVMAILDSIFEATGLSALRTVPIVGSHLEVGVAILMVWLLDIHLVAQFTNGMREEWLSWVVDGVVIFGMIPVKDAFVGAIEKGLRA